MANGFCNKHGGKTDTTEFTVKEPKETTPETARESAGAEKLKPKARKSPVSKKSTKAKTEKPKAAKCGVILASGKPCKNWAMANGRCRSHQTIKPANTITAPKPQQEKPTEDVLSSLRSPSEKEKKTVVRKYGAYINRLISMEEEEVFQEHYDHLLEDYGQNNSSDRMNCEMACLYYVWFLQAMKKSDAETALKIDQLFRDKLQDLKTAKEK